MLMKVRYLEYSGMSQGNIGMRIVFVLVSLLLLIGIGQVRISIQDWIVFKEFCSLSNKLLVFFSKVTERCHLGWCFKLLERLKVS